MVVLKDIFFIGTGVFVCLVARVLQFIATFSGASHHHRIVEETKVWNASKRIQRDFFFHNWISMNLLAYQKINLKNVKRSVDNFNPM